MEASRVCGIRIVTQVRQDLLIASQVNEETSHESLTTNPVSRFIWTDPFESDIYRCSGAKGVAFYHFLLPSFPPFHLFLSASPSVEHTMDDKSSRTSHS